MEERRESGAAAKRKSKESEIHRVDITFCPVGLGRNGRCICGVGSLALAGGSRPVCLGDLTVQKQDLMQLAGWGT
jgi:hypothetical protein